MPRDAELEKVVNAWTRIDPDGIRIGNVLRRTLDQLYDGKNTGRYRWDQLHKTEKTHCGTLVEINLHREFKFKDGTAMDYVIDGVEVDCKYSQRFGSWMIPNEAMNHICLLISADDDTSKWSMGIVRISDAILTAGGNRDAKRTISAAGRTSIKMIYTDEDLPPNILIHLPRPTVDALMNLPNGQQRINQIFRIAQNKRISRGVIATLGQQDDYMKRVRGNGGARTTLNQEGIIILGDYLAHQEIARKLGLVIPDSGEFVGARISLAQPRERNTVEIDGKLWRVAKPGDPVMAVSNPEFK